MTFLRWIAVAVCTPILITPLSAQTSFPMITHANPVAIQRGTTSEVEVSGQMDFAGAYKVLLEGTGVKGEVLKPDAKKSTTRTVKVAFQVAADAALGVRDYRLATSLGISSLGQIVVVDHPVVAEKAGSTKEKPQPIALPCVVCGRTEVAENVDYYRFAAKSGQVLTFEVFSARIQDKIHDLQKHADPLIAILDSKGRELASNDDGSFADPVLVFKVPADGDYTVLIRDAKYDGDPRWVYALAITNRPYVLQSFPLGVTEHKEVTLHPVMSGGAKVAWKITPPKDLGIHALSFQPKGEPVTNPFPVVVTHLPTVDEVEPNDSPSQAMAVPVPVGINGRIGQRRDLDYYRFTGVKGKTLTFTIYARRFGTPLQSKLDSVIDILTKDGRLLATNDDGNGKDAALTFTPNADGDYLVRVRELNSKGGEEFVYFLEIDTARPNFTLKADPSKAMIGPGSRTAWFVQVTRQNGFNGAVKVEVENLPKEASVNALTIPANMTQGLLVVSAAEKAKPDAEIVKVVGIADVEGRSTRRVATPVEEIYMPGGGRGRFDVDMQAVAITGPSDVLDVQVKPQRIELKPGQEVKIDVQLKRGDYDKAVTLDVHLRHLNTMYGNCLPPGVTMVESKSKTLIGTGSVGHIVLKADANAEECKDIPISVQAFVPINFVVKIGYSSPAILLSIKK